MSSEIQKLKEAKNERVTLLLLSAWEKGILVGGRGVVSIALGQDKIGRELRAISGCLSFPGGH